MGRRSFLFSRPNTPAYNPKALIIAARRSLVAVGTGTSHPVPAAHHPAASLLPASPVPLCAKPFRQPNRCPTITAIMLGTPVEKLIYDYMFPKPRANDPQNFQALLTRSLIPEVRTETQAFYGHLETHEAKYPGLDYNNRTHRIRLSRFPWHRRLFRAVDGLGLTPAEVSSITRWEGTKWAKEKYEREQGVSIEDTADAADESLPRGIPTWDDELNRPVYQGNPELTAEPEGIVDEDEEEDGDLRAVQDPGEDDEDEEEEQSEEDDQTEPVAESVGVGLNARLRERAARREAGETNVVLDEEWEQWLKSVLDSGILHDDMSDDAFRSFFQSTVVPAGLVPVDIMCAAREGRWDDVPSYLHSLLRHALGVDQRFEAAPVIPRSVISRAIEGTSRTNYRSIRFPWDESTGRTATDASES